jgi:hypothetical protein
MQMPSMRILIAASLVMVTQFHLVQIATTAAGQAPTEKHMLQTLTTAKHVTETILTETEIRTEIAVIVTMRRHPVSGSTGIITPCLIQMTAPIVMAQTLPGRIPLYPVSHVTVESAPLTARIVIPALLLPILIPPTVTPRMGSITRAQGIHKETAPIVMICLPVQPMIFCCLPL